MKNHYKTLGIARNATPGQIKVAYKRLALQYHPDRNPGDLFAEELFKEINEAYHVLSKPDSKGRYDILLDFQVYQQQPQSYTFHHPYSYRRSRQPVSPRTTYRFDRTYFKHQALAILVVIFIGTIYISATYLNKYMKEQKREEIRIANQKVLSAAHVKFNMGDFYGAMQMVENLANKHPTEFYINVERSEMVEEVYRKARRQYVLQDYQNAIFNLLIVKEFQNPQKLETYEYLARSYLAINDYKKAASALEYIYLRDRYNIDLVVRLAMLYHYQVNDISQSLKYYGKAKKLFKERQRQLYGKAFELLMDPLTTPDLYYKLFYNRAKANMEAKNFKTAVTDCNWASFLRPDEPEPYFMRAVSYNKINESKKACKDYKVALSKGYEPGVMENFCK
jgi:curved DNA-binding protein CbpA